MSYLWKVGDKAVCVDDTKIYPDSGVVKKGQIYTIRKVGPYIDYYEDGNPLSIWLEGIVRSFPICDEADFPLHARRFRPIVKTDISIFTAMLVPAPSKKVEHAA